MGDKKASLHNGHRERMRQRFLETSGVGMADHELLELLLYYAIPRKDTNATAHRLMEEFGSLAGVLEADVNMLCRVEEVSLGVATFLKTLGEVSCRYAVDKFDPEGKKAVYDTPEKVALFLASRYLSVPVERVYLLLFDNSMHLLDCYPVCDGSIVGAGASVRRMAEHAYKKGAAAAILAHNHPGGVPIPSKEDIRITRRLYQALDILEVPLLEHYIFAEKTYAMVLKRCIDAKDEDDEEQEARVAAPPIAWNKKQP